MAGAGSPARRDSVLRIPHHGRYRAADAGRRGRELVAALPRRAVRLTVVPARLSLDLAPWLCCGYRRLGDDGGWPPALDGLWLDAHGGFGAALAHRPCSAAVPARLY